jgi:hypothetical protein
MTKLFFSSCLIVLTYFFSPVAEVHGQKLCFKKRQSVNNSGVQLGKRVLRVKNKCRRAFVDVLDINSLRGPSPYGDGSAGEVIITSDRVFNFSNTQFRSLTINEGVTVEMPSGTIIRVQQNFINRGNIIVTAGASGSPGSPIAGTGSLPTAHQGIGFRAAISGANGDGSDFLPGGRGGISAGLEGELDVLFGSKAYYGRAPAGSGGSSGPYAGSPAGGAFYVFSGQTIRVEGLIAANGEDADADLVPCVGGGAAGLIVLAAKNELILTGGSFLSVRGGAGGESGQECGAGGGGSGGLIALYAPSIDIDDAATSTLTGGAAGAVRGSVTSSPRSSGGGGGALGANGGEGASIGAAPANNVVAPAEPGGMGRRMFFDFDPSSLL